MTRGFARRAFSSLLQLTRSSQNQDGRNRTSRRRLLRVEQCENRAMLASVTGIKYQDMTGDGFTPGDLPLGGFTIDLYRDGGDGVFDLVDDTLDDSQITDATTGAYTFSGLTDGRYFLQEQPLAGWTQTAGPAYYTFDVIGDNVYTDVGLVVDSFAEPDPAGNWAISSFSPNPAEFTHTGSMLGGERELTIEVLGAPGAISASGSIGAGFLDFATGGGEPGSKAVLTYDGTVLTPLSEDLTDGGVNTAFRLDMTMLQVADLEADSMGVVIDLAGPAGTATYTVMLSESIGAESHYIPFADFTTTGTFSFQDVTSATVTFNPTGVPDVDFILDAIVVMQGPQSFDFGNYQELPDITGVKYHDVKGDGITGDDLPLGGFSIQLYRDDGDGAFDPGEDELVDTQVTDATTGEYTFGDLEDGVYFVCEVVSDGWSQTGPADPAYYTVEILNRLIVDPGDYDFANYPDAPAITGVKYHDLDGDGLAGDDLPLGGFSIQLYRDDGDGAFDPGEDELVDTQVTDATTGEYTFGDLEDGVYFVCEVVSDGWSQTGPADPAYYTVEILNRLIVDPGDYDFANYPDAPAITGVKYHDLDGDGLAGDDLPLGGFSIQLYRDDGDGAFDPGEDELVDTQVTDATTGEYTFGDLEDGVYFVCEVVSDGWSQTGPADPAYYTVEILNRLIVDPGDYDFANYPDAPAITGVKYHDLDGDGLAGDDLPLGGFSIQLYRDDGDGAFDPGEDELVDTQVTDATTGEYTFGDLEDGVYFVCEVVSDGWSQTGPADPAYYTVEILNRLIVDPGDYDFANYPDAPAITGVKYHDLYDDGSTDDYVPLAGFTIRLYTDTNDNGVLDDDDELIDSQTTASDTGAYSFTDLADGRYFVREVAVDGWTRTAPADPGYYTVEIVNRLIVDPADYDFANYAAPSSLSGFVYVDINNDGVKQASESVIANAVVWLSGVDNLGNTIDPISTTTDLTGAYTFQNLLPGTYTLTEVQPAAFVDGIDTIGTPGGTVGNDVFSNIVLPAGYDGVNNNFGERSLLPELYSKRVLIRPALPDDVFNADTGEALNPDTGEVILLAAPVASTAYDLVGRASNGAWWVGESDGASSFTNQYGTKWSTNVTWEHVMVGDFNGDGVDDIVGRVSHNGDWWVGLSNGDGTFTNTKWTRWSTGVTWTDVMVGDFNGDGMDDIIGRVQSNGDWWIGSSTGTGFTNAKWTRWSTGVTWTDVMVGDFNGDGMDDIIGRASHNGDWWIGSSTGTGFANARWTRWSTGVTWTNVMVGDFNGDGCDDLVGRVQSNGDWWVASSTGVGFTNAKWTRWSTNVDWLDVMVGDFGGDGSDDLVGRVSHNGDWWIGSSTGTAFTNARWTRWSATAGWDHVMVGNFSAAAMQAESAVEVSQIEPESLTLADLQSVVEEAAFRLTEDLEGLAFQVCITDLAGLRLAVTAGNTILVDANAAGYGWYVGTTDEAFVATGAEGVLAALADSEAADRMDLLTVVMHEMGHLLGHGHDAEGLMQPTLRAGTRLQPTGDQAAEAYAAMAWLDDLALSRKTSDRSVQVQAVDEALMVYWN